MPTTNLGRIALLYRGMYNADTQYNKLDMVRHSGAGYISLQPSKGVTPGTDETKWAMAWQDGADGTNGADGAEIVSASFNGNNIVFTLNNSRTVTITDGKTAITGVQGPTGPTGLQGPQGIQGPKGDTGDIGPQGIQGLKGDTGDIGPQGIQGLKGDKGDAGLDGGTWTSATEIPLVDAGNHFKNDNVEAAFQQLTDRMLWRKTAALPFAQISPVPESPLDITVKTVANQAGSGDPSPENIRPMSPALLAGQQVTVKRIGKNIKKLNAFSLTANGFTATVNANGEISVVGTPTNTNSTSLESVDFLIKPGIYTMSLNKTSTCRVSLLIPTSGYATVASIASGGTSTSLTITKEQMVRFFVGFESSQVGVSQNIQGLCIQLEYGSSATSIESYVEDSLGMTAQADIYGLTGAEDEIGIDGHEKHGSLLRILNGSETYIMSGAQPSDTTFFKIFTNAATGAGNGLAMSNMFPYYPYNVGPERSGESVGLANPGGEIGFWVKKSRITGWDDAWTNTQKTDAFKAWLSALNTAGTPLKVIYQLAVPTTTQGVAQIMKSLAQADRYTPRINNIYASVGNVEIGYAEANKREDTYLAEKTGYGIVSGLGVTAQATPNMSVNIGSGVCYKADGTRFELLSIATLDVKAADATNPRIDIVYISTAGVRTYLAGTAAATPSAPAIPSGGLLLAEIAVAAGATTIQAANITSRKKGLWTEDWITPTLINGWIPYDAAANRPAQYRIDALGRVQHRGMIRGGTVGQPAYNIIAGYRTVQGRNFAIASNNTYGQISVSNVITPTNCSNAWVCLDSVQYYAEA